MPTCREHHQQADHNKCLFDSLPCRDSYRDWAVVLLHYTCLHLLDAFLDLKRQHPESHTDRRNRLRGLRPRTRDLALCLTAYEEMGRLSHKARYECRQITEQDLADATTVFPSIRTWVEVQLSQRGFAGGRY